MDPHPKWSDLGLRAVNMGTHYERFQLPKTRRRRVERLLVPDETGCVGMEIVTDEPERDVT